MRVPILAAWLVLELAAGLGAQARIAWQPSVAAAFAKAKEDALPIWLVVHGAGNRGRPLSRGSLWDKRIVQMSRGFSCLMADPQSHAKVFLNGKTLWRCREHGHPSCKQHQKAYAAATKRWPFLKADRVTYPQHVFFMPDGMMLRRVGGPLTVHRLLFDLLLAARAAGKADADESADRKRFEALRRRLTTSDSGRKVTLRNLAALPLVEARRTLLSWCSAKRPVHLQLQVLQTIGAQGSFEALPKLIRLAKGRGGVQEAAVRALGELRLLEAVPALLRLAKTASPPHELPRALLLAGEADPEATAWLAATIAHGRNELAVAAMKALLDIERPPATLVAATYKRQKSRRGTLRDTAIDTLRELGKRGIHVPR